ncbi:MAG: dermonecrotic toxin domain-containing protein [Candidatus Rhabdochlamydia sp.]
MDITQESITIKAKLEQIPFNFREMAKEELQKELRKLNHFLLLDPDKVYVNIERDGSISSETLTEALLKKSINEQNFLSDNLAGLYLNPTDVNVENQIGGVNISDIKNSIDQLNATLINTYHKQSDITIKAKLEQIPLNFREMAKEELQKELRKLNHFLLLDPDKIYVNVVRDGSISSETLTEALLKKSINEQNFLSDNLARLYLSPTEVNVENQIGGVNISNLKNSIDQLSVLLISAYQKQSDDFWASHKISIPNELQIDSIHKFLKFLTKNSSLIEKAHQLETMYPNLKQTITVYFSKKLKRLYHKDSINPDAIRVFLFTKGNENNSQPFLSLDLTSFALHYLWFSYWLSHFAWDSKTIEVKLGLNDQNLQLNEILQKSDILAIQSKHQTKLDVFWQKNFNNYQILAKFSYLRALLEQQNSPNKLSEKGFELAFKAIGFSQEKIETLDEFDPKDLPLDILETLSHPNCAEVSCLSINNQTSSDILKIRNTETNDLLVYIPGYTPSFIEGANERILTHWIFHQTQLLPDNLAKIASHFPYASRKIDIVKLDAFLYPDYINQNENVIETIAQEDIFYFLTRRQKTRVSADFHADGVPTSVQLNSFPNYQSIDSAFFTTITAAIEYLPYLLPNIHTISSDLHELFPNPYTTASRLMKKGIKDKLGMDIDPDKTFIQLSLHAIKIPYDPMVPPISGDGVSITTQSLTEAALSNYREEHFFYSYAKRIIYQDLSGEGEYTSSDQLVNILPKDIEEIIQKEDLNTLHKNKLDIFWNAHADRIKYFIKYRYLQQVLEEHQKGTLSEDDFKTLTEIAFYSLSLEQEEWAGFINPDINIQLVSIGGYQSTDLFLFCDINKPKVILYIPGNTEAFFVFASYEECICFLEETAKTSTHWQKLLSSHFSMDDQDGVVNSLKRGPYIYLIKSPFTYGVAFVPADCSFADPDIRHPITAKPIEKSFFEVIQENTQERSYLDANAVITSDTELMLKRLLAITESIQMVLLIPSLAFPLLNWVSLAALATEAAINLYIAKNADTVKERHQAAVAAGVNSMEFILFAAFLSPRLLNFSKNRSLSEIKMQEKSLPLNSDTRPLDGRPLNSGSGIFSFSGKTPVTEEKFFDTTESIKVWQMADSQGLLHHLDSKAWFLDEQFLLFTGKTNKSNHLIISSHGGYFPKSDIVKVPKNTELVVLGPHGRQLVDPGTAKVAKKLILPYGIITENTAIPTQTALYPSLFSRSVNVHMHPRQIDLKLLAGTNVPGHIRNYTLRKFQNFGIGQESYLDIVQIVHHSRHPFPNIYKIGFKPVDVLTIRNRRGMSLPTLRDVFEALQSRGIHYDRITLEFCRSKPLSTTSPLLWYMPAKF